MQVLPYNLSYAAGTIVEIGQPYDNNGHKVVPFVISCVNQDGSKPIGEKFLQIKAWDSLADQVTSHQPGDKVQVKISLTSKRNKKQPDLWYHVISLREIFFV